MISPTPSESPAQTCGAQSFALDPAAKLFLGLAVGLGVCFGMALAG